MSLFGRTRTIVESKMSKVLDKAEDPNETLDYAYEKQIQLLQNVKRGLAELVTSRRRLQLEHDRLQQQSDKLDQQAQQAVAAGRDDLARTALQRKAALHAQLDTLDHQIEQLETQQQKLTQSEQTLETKIEAFRSTKEAMKAQYSASQAQVKISEAATGISEEMGDVGLAIQRAQDRTEQMQARAAALDELTAEGALPDLSGNDDLDRQLADLSAGNEIDQQLAAMKAQLAPPQKQLESGS
ncbi:MAG TPA: PspA/IM30 family protein [Chloroflexota bacterium]|nr:PspA/IM30 family protein [Chloroflexota bacterium]